MFITCCRTLIRLVGERATCPTCGTVWLVKFERNARGLPVGFTVERMAEESASTTAKGGKR